MGSLDCRPAGRASAAFRKPCKTRGRRAEVRPTKTHLNSIARSHGTADGLSFSYLYGRSPHYEARAACLSLELPIGNRRTNRVPAPEADCCSSDPPSCRPKNVFTTRTGKRHIGGSAWEGGAELAPSVRPRPGRPRRRSARRTAGGGAKAPGVGWGKADTPPGYRATGVA
jgi:hypothetical protein